MSQVQPAIVGVSMSHFATRRDDASFHELLSEAAAGALTDATLEMSDIDAVVLAQAPDALHGIGHPEQTAVSALGAGGKPMLRVHTGGATGASAAQAASQLVQSGRFQCVLVVGAEKMGDNLDGAQRVLNEIWHPIYESAMPLNTLAMTSLVATRYMSRYGAGEEDYARIASRLRSGGVVNEKAHLRVAMSEDEVLASRLLTWPVRLGMSCPRSTGACAIVIAAAPFARKLGVPKAWIKAFAARANTYFMGDRMGAAGDNAFENLMGLNRAAKTAYSIAGMDRPVDDLGVAEPYVPFAPMEPPILEALELAPRGEAFQRARDGHFDPGGSLPVCPSGGVLCANPISVTGLVRVAEAAEQVRMRAGDHQVDGARTALATGTGGDYQFFVVGILGSDEE